MPQRLPKEDEELVHWVKAHLQPELALAALRFLVTRRCESLCWKEHVPYVGYGWSKTENLLEVQERVPEEKVFREEHSDFAVV